MTCSKKRKGGGGGRGEWVVGGGARKSLGIGWEREMEGEERGGGVKKREG